MLYIGVDIGCQKHWAAILAVRSGKKYERGDKIAFNNSHDGLDKLIQAIETTKEPNEKVLVCIEGTGHYWFTLYFNLAKRGYEAVIVNPFDIAHYRKIHKRGTKTDPSDAMLLAKLVSEKESYQNHTVNEAQINFEQRNLARAWIRLCTRDIPALKNRIHRIAYALFPEIEQTLGTRFTKTLLAVLKKWPTPEKLLKAEEIEIAELLRSASKGHIDNGLAAKLIERARNSFGLTGNISGFEIELEVCIAQLEMCLKQEKLLEIELLSRNTELADRLAGTGLGKISRVALITEIGDHKRFARLEEYRRYCGMNPTVKKSGKYTGKSRLSKAGNKYLRQLYMRAAQSAMQHVPEYKEFARMKKTVGKKHKWIQCAVANRMVNSTFRILNQ